MTLTDEQFFLAVKEGKREDLYRVYQEFTPGIIQLITRNGGTREDARDVFQTALTVIYQRSQSEKFQLSGSFGGLLYGICRNIWGNRLQKRSFREVRIPEDFKYDLDDQWEERIEEEEKRRLLRDQLAELGEDCRRVLELFFDGRTMEEIQREMGFGSVSYTSKRKFICKERLIQRIKQDPRYQELK